MRRMRRRVERRLGRRVVQRRVAEAANHDRAVGPWALDAELACPVDRYRNPHRTRQVRGDRRGLRDHGQRVVAEHLVPPACDRLVDRGGDALHHVGDAVPACLRRAGEVEGAGAVVEERGIRGTQGKRDRRVALVPSRADRVEGALLLLEPARRVVAMPALDLRAPERLGVRVGCRRNVGRGRERLEGREKMLLERIEIVGNHGRKASSRRTRTDARPSSRAPLPIRPLRPARPRRAGGWRGHRHPRGTRCR